MPERLINTRTRVFTFFSLSPFLKNSGTCAYYMWRNISRVLCASKDVSFLLHRILMKCSKTTTEKKPNQSHTRIWNNLKKNWQQKNGNDYMSKIVDNFSAYESVPVCAFHDDQDENEEEYGTKELWNQKHVVKKHLYQKMWLSLGQATIWLGNFHTISCFRCVVLSCDKTNSHFQGLFLPLLTFEIVFSE